MHCFKDFSLDVHFSKQEHVTSCVVEHKTSCVADRCGSDWSTADCAFACPYHDEISLPLVGNLNDNLFGPTLFNA